MNKTVLTILAHPDDAEFMCAGTLALLKQNGWDIHIATMTPGDCGSAKLNRQQISKIRRVEAANAAEILKGTYHCLECEDVFIMYDKPTLLKVIEVLRNVRPAIVFTHSPQDYFADHENTSRLAWNACFSVGMPNVKTKSEKPLEHIPLLYYVDPMEGKDISGNEIKPTTMIDVTTVIDTKEKMLCCHESQRNWLLSHHGIDEYIISMKRFDKQRGQRINKDYAEGFRQHLGHPFVKNNILKTELSDLVHLL